jgi:RNA polymerase-binding transcription factor DksA
MPNPQELADIRAALTRDRTSTLARLATLEQELSGLVEAADTANIDDEHDPEGATTAFERAQVISLLEQARRQLDALDAADARMAAGTFGLCQRCAAPIAVARLLALPSATACVGCADTERRQRL